MSGSGGGGGYEYQAKATAYVAAHILAGSGLKWIEHENPDVPVAVAEETGGAGDDLHIVLDDSTEVEIQAKHGLKKNDKFWQAILKLGQGLKDNEKLYGVLLTDSTASKVLREDLRCDLKRIGQGRTDGLKLITKELQHKFAAADLPTESPDLFRRLRIVVVDLDDDLPDGKQAYLLLKEFLDDASQASITWSTLCQEGQYLLSNRGRRDSTEWARLLSSKGIQMKSIYAQVNHMRMPQEKQYLDNLISQFEYGWWQESFKFLYEIDAIDEDSWKPFELKGLIRHKGKKPNPDEKPEPLLKLIKTSQHQRILIVGRSGMGKSTLMRRLLGIKAQEALDDEEIPIPVLVSLSTSEKVIDLIRSSLTNAGLFLTTEQIQKKLADRKLLLLLDGLNEVPDSNMLTDLKNNFSNAPMILTTRETYRDLGIEAQLMIEPLKSSDIEGFLYQTLDEDSSQIQKLCDQMKDFSTPLMAWMLYCIFEMMQEIVPATRGEAYQLFTTIYEEKAKQEFSLEVLREGMRKLAVEMTNCKNCLLESEAKRLVTIEVFARLQASHLLQCKSSGREKKIEFCHPSIQEYYAAEYLIGDRQKFESWFEVEVNQKYSIFQQDYLNYTKWTEPIALMLGLPEVNQETAVKIVEQALDVDLMVGARLAGEVRSGFQERTVRLVQSSQLPNKIDLPEWMKVDLLGFTKSDCAAKLLNEIICSSEEDSNLSDRAMWELRNMAPKTSIPLLKNAFEKGDKFARFQVIRALIIVSFSDAIVLALSDINPELRRFSIHKIGETRTEESTIAIIELISISKKNITTLQPKEVKYIEGTNLKDLSVEDTAYEIEKEIISWGGHFIKEMPRDILVRALLMCIDRPDNDAVKIIATGIFKQLISSLMKIQEEVNCESHLFYPLEVQKDDSQEEISMAEEDFWRSKLTDSNPIIRGNAIVELSYLVKEIPISLVMKMLDDPNIEVSSCMAQAITQIVMRFPEQKEYMSIAIKRIIDLFQNSSDFKRILFVEALGILGAVNDEVICKVLTHEFKESNGIDCTYAIAAITCLQCSEALPEMVKKFNASDASIQAAIAENLPKFKDAASVLPDLWRFLNGNGGMSIFKSIQLIQANCKFYNYEIEQQAKLRKDDRTSPEGDRDNSSSSSTIVYGDYIAGDKIGRDKILGNKTEAPNATEVKIFEQVESYHESPPPTQDPSS